MTTRYLLGLLGDEGSEYDGISYDECDSDHHAALSQTVAEKAMVLLKNDGVLPLSLDKLGAVGVIGPNADSVACLEGNYNGTSSRYVTFLEGIRTACEGKARVFYSQGCHLYRDRTSNLARPDDRLAEAVAVTERCDVSILCLGLDATLEGEEGDTGNEYSSGDKATLDLPPCQQNLLRAVLAVGKPVVVVLAAGSALSVADGNAILQVWYPGQAGGTALARILFGQVSPSGKLPVTFYRSVADLPPFEEYAMTNRTYRYFEGEALYPFGFGLGYSRFIYSDAYYRGGVLNVTVTNAGPMDADEVVQVYIKDHDSPFAPRNHSLCAMKRITLASGTTATVSMPIRDGAFESVDDEGMLTRLGRRYSLYVGGSQPDARSVALTAQACLRVDVTQ
jgi:beta-glucosidase